MFRHPALLSSAIALACIVGAATAEELPQKRTYDRIQALQGVASSQSVSIAGSAVPVLPAGSLGGRSQPGCDLESPENLGLRKRVTWGRTAALCLRGYADALNLAAVQAPSAEISIARKALATEFLATAARAEEEANEADAQADFLGLNLGIGLGASYYFDDAIEEAEVVDGIVRVTKDRRAEPRVLLEFHRFLFPRKPGEDNQAIRYGHGPFVAVAAKEDDVLGGVAAGWMFGWKDTSKPDDSNAFTVGLGIILDAGVRTLADGFKEGQPLPSGETQVRFEEESRAAAVLIFTRTF